MESRRGETTRGILEERQEMFAGVHKLIRQYKAKIRALGREKNEIERKYKHLKAKKSSQEEGTPTEGGGLWAEKVEMLQRWSERQQVEMENTIEMYEAELGKIEARRREELAVS